MARVITALVEDSALVYNTHFLSPRNLTPSSGLPGTQEYTNYTYINKQNPYIKWSYWTTH